MMVSDESNINSNASPFSSSSSPDVTDPIDRIPSFPPTTAPTTTSRVDRSDWSVSTLHASRTPITSTATGQGGGGGVGHNYSSSGINNNNNNNNACIRFTCQVLHRFCTIVTYPFMVLFTLVSLILLTFFCIFPTLLCLTFGTCLYYCLMEDPIPLSVLLRYMLSPDADDTSNPTSLYPMTQQRPVIQSKLIVRKLLRIEDIITVAAGGNNNNNNNNNNEISTSSTMSEYPRKHPFPIHLSTESKCLYFSEPLAVEEEDDNEEDNNDNNNNNIDDEDNSIVSNGETFRIDLPEEEEEEEENIGPGSTTTTTMMENQQSDNPGISGIVITDTTSDQMTSVDEVDDVNGKRSRTSEVGATTIAEPLSQQNPEDNAPKSETKDIDDHPNNKNNDPVEILDIGSSQNMVAVETVVDETSISSAEGDNNPSKVGKDIEEQAEEGNIIVNRGGDNDMNQDADGKEIDDITTEEGDTQEQQQEEESVTTKAKKKKEDEEDYFGICESRDRGTSCDICLLEYQVGDIIAWSPNLECTHTFHRDCVLDWLVRKPTCPICRHDYLKGKNDESV